MQSNTRTYSPFSAGNEPSPKGDPLDVKSSDIRAFFQKHKIVPYKHPKYKKYFIDQPAEIALTYEWTSSFRHLKTFLSKDNVRRHNRLSLDPNPSPLHRLYLLSFLWVFLGPPAPS